MKLMLWLLRRKPVGRYRGMLDRDAIYKSYPYWQYDFSVMLPKVMGTFAIFKLLILVKF